MDSAESLQLSVRRLNAWLGTGSKAEGWRRALWIAALETQAARGYSADPVLLQQILAQFDAGYGGLEHPNFQDTRRNLESHLQRVQRISSEPLAAQIAAARTTFRPITEADVNAVRDELTASLARLKKRCEASLDAGERDALYTSLGLGELEQEIAGLKIADLLVPSRTSATPPSTDPPLPSEDTDPAASQAARDSAAAADRQDQEQDQARARERNAERTRVLRSLLRHVRSFESASVENPDIWMLSAAVACDRFVRVMEAATSTQTATSFQRWLDTLEQDLPLLDNPADRRAAVRAGEALGKLGHSLQAPELVAAVWRRYGQPNLYVEVSGSLLSSLINRTSSDVLPVDELILGRQIRGTAQTTNDVSLELLSDPNQVTASIHLLGRIHSDNYTKQGPITAYAGSNGVYEGRKNLYANIGGFYATDPYVSVNNSSYFRGVDCRLRLVQKIAVKQYQKDKSLTEGISASRIETRVDRQFGEQTDEALANARPRLAERHPQLFDFGRWVPEIALTSSPNAILATGFRTDPARIGAPSPPPAGRIPADVRCRLHQSSISNYIEPLVAGRQFTNQELGDLFVRLTGEFPEAFQIEEGDEPWSIVFPAYGAISVALADQKIVVEITGARFSQADRQINAPIIIRLQVALIRQDGKTVVRQVAPPVLTYGEGADRNARVVGFKSFLEGKLEAGYRANEAGTILPDNLIPAERLEDERMREFAATLQLVDFRIEDGWLTAGWKKSAGPDTVHGSDLPAIHPALLAAAPAAGLPAEAPGESPAADE